MNFGRDVNRRLDLPILGAVFLLSICGLLGVYSATGGEGPFWRQVLWMASGWGVLAASFFIPYRWLVRYSPLFYGAAVVALGLLALMTFTRGGVNRWLVVTGVTFQPAEFAKVGTAAVLALLLDYFHRLDSLGQFAPAILVAAVPAVLIAAQPDLGTAAVFIPILGAALFYGGARPAYLFLVFSPLCGFVASFKLWLFIPFIIVVVAVTLGGITGWRDRLVLLVGNAAAAFAKPLAWGVLKEYQKARLLSFLTPTADPRGQGYSVIQAKIALGSGRLWGKGFLEGTQVHLKFLPEGHTDFIFPTWGEEWGFVGCALVVALFAVLFVRAALIAFRAADRRGAVLAFTLGSYLFFQFAVNAAMAAGLMPVTGIPLPFLSYGGSVTLTSFAAVGLILNVKYRREKVLRELKIRGY